MKQYKLHLGSNKEVLKTFEDNSVDSIITDPPYEYGFMSKAWDSTGIAYDVELWKECLRVVKPGGYIMAFGSSRTHHRLMVAIEDAGFEIRETLAWAFGSGFPKSLNIQKQLQKMGSDRADDFEGWGTNLKPAVEYICMARKPLSEKTVAENCLKWVTGGINIDESRVEGIPPSVPQPQLGVKKAEIYNFATGEGRNGEMSNSTFGRFPANLITDGSEEVRECFPDNIKGEIGRAGRKSGGNYEASSYKVGVVTETGFKDNGNASRFFKSIIYQAKASKSERNKGCEGLETKQTQGGGGGIGDYQDDVNSMSGKYGSEKAPAKNNHPTVKPIALMEYLIKMVTPKGGIVLDPFNGSGSTGCGAVKNGFEYIGIDITPEYIEISECRIKAHIPAKDLFSNL